MGFRDFQGNHETVTRLRQMLGRGRFPHAVILAGPRGAGKYTLAQMLAKAMNCLAPPTEAGHAPSLPDFCGACANCTRIALADALDERCAEAVEAREGLRETDKRETRILINTHPNVLVVPPDPPQMLIKVDQVRHVIHGIYFRPSEDGRKVYIFTQAAFMKEAANALLKVLEEPPEFATMFLLAENPGELLATIRSRCVTLRLAALPASEIEQHLARTRPELAPKQRALVARLAQGAIGRAQTLDLAAYMTARQDAIGLLTAALGAPEHSDLFRMTETYRAGAEGREKTEQLIATLYGLLEDLLVVKAGTPELARNLDIGPQLAQWAPQASVDWIGTASDALREIETGMRRNVLRSLALDNFAARLADVGASR
jgi:DNA polymerase-3 subunit delta'